MSNDKVTARHCWNSGCSGPEWWNFFDESEEKHAPCPSCGFPCQKEETVDNFSADDVCNALLATTIHLQKS